MALEPIAADDDQMEEFLTNLDPFYSNSIKLDAIKNFGFLAGAGRRSTGLSA